MWNGDGEDWGRKLQSRRVKRVKKNVKSRKRRKSQLWMTVECVLREMWWGDMVVIVLAGLCRCVSDICCVVSGGSWE